MISEFPFDPSAMIVQAHQFSKEKWRRDTNWTKDSFVEALIGLYQQFEHIIPLGVYVRIGPRPAYESQERLRPLGGSKGQKPYSLFVAVHYNIDQQEAHPSRLVEKFMQVWNGSHPTTISIDTSYMPEDTILHKEEIYAQRGFVKIFPLPGVTKEVLEAMRV